jgi:hypothetical protein
VLESIKEFVNFLCKPQIFLTISTGLFVLMLVYYRQVTQPKTATLIALIFFGGYFASALDPNFASIVKKPDNVPITLMLIIFGFFLWLSLRKAAINDERMEKGLPPLEKTEVNDKVLVWPDLVYEEFIAALICTAFLLAWGVAFAAPLEEPANAGKSPNPAKAPWYFLGLQEMLVYFDPWIAGVALPGMIVTGLIAIPYIDNNKKGNGYYTFAERKFAISTFLFGFLVLWVVLIFLGTFLRGPNWNFYGPYEVWDVHKQVALTNINLSEIIWVKMFGMSLPNNWLIRESFGLLATIAYLAILPVALTLWWKPLRRMWDELGPLRYSILLAHLIIMAALPIKMILRWVFNLKYIVFIPEFFLNI